MRQSPPSPSLSSSAGRQFGPQLSWFEKAVSSLMKHEDHLVSTVFLGMKCAFQSSGIHDMYLYIAEASPADVLIRGTLILTIWPIYFLTRSPQYDYTASKPPWMPSRG